MPRAIQQVNFCSRSFFPRNGCIFKNTTIINYKYLFTIRIHPFVNKLMRSVFNNLHTPVLFIQCHSVTIICISGRTFIIKAHSRVNNPVHLFPFVCNAVEVHIVRYRDIRQACIFRFYLFCNIYSVFICICYPCLQFCPASEIKALYLNLPV